MARYPDVVWRTPAADELQAQVHRRLLSGQGKMTANTIAIW
jgi:hypothetical protein